MSNSLPLNPFTSVRPRGQDTAPSKAPRKTNPVERAALVALNHARNDRSQPKSRKAIG